MNPFPTGDSNLDEAIESAFADLKSYSANEEGYQTTVDQIAKLYKLKHDQSKLNLELHQTDSKITLEAAQVDAEAQQKAKPFYKRVDPNTALTVAGNLLIGLAVIKYEQTGVIATKVQSFLKKV